MSTLSTLAYEAQHPRLRVTGACRDDEASRIGEAVLTFARGGTNLIVDLTAVTEMSADVARALLMAQATVPDCRVALIRKSGSRADRCLRESRWLGPGSLVG